ncbi:MAG: hypothetical protein FWD34_00780 [Oscillospiraceae bacterium]|nr:hypothetical protein [Oscillospiraceae bacterium]
MPSKKAESNDSKPNFVKLGDVRIKLSNIKNYGINSQDFIRFGDILEKSSNIDKYGSSSIVIDVRKVHINLKMDGLAGLFGNTEFVDTGERVVGDGDYGGKLVRNSKGVLTEVGYEYTSLGHKVGIFSKSDVYEKEYTYKYIKTCSGNLHVFLQEDEDIIEGLDKVFGKAHDIKMKKNNVFIHFSENEFIEENHEYLYITTYQNDNYEFLQFEIDFDIRKKCDDLDKWLTE